MMVDWQLVFLCVVQIQLTWTSETQLLGYQETQGLSLNSDPVEKRTLITDPTWSFPSDGHVVAFNVRVHGDALGSNISLQIWRPTGQSGLFSLVSAAHDVEPSTTGYQRINLPVPQRILRGDVIGLYSEGKNPVSYLIPEGGPECNQTGFLYFNGHAAKMAANAGGSDEGAMAFTQSGQCRLYLVTAEYQLDDIDLPLSFLGDEVKSRTEPGEPENGVILPHIMSGFVSDGMLYGWKAFLQGLQQPVIFQVWRSENGSEYTKIHQSPAYSQPIVGAVHFRLRPTERTLVRRGDVIALAFSHFANAIWFDWSTNCENPCMVGVAVAGADNDKLQFTDITGEKSCRSYSFQAEYYYKIPEVPSTSTFKLSNITTPTLATPTSTIMPPNSTITPPNSTITPPNVTTTTTPTATTTTATAAQLPSTSTKARPTTPMQAYFGWDMPSANKLDTARLGTIIPDAGHGFPQDGKVIGWVFNATQIGKLGVGLQVWRPMPEHPSLTPHARDFAYVGGTKPVRPWHIGENRFSLDQVGEAPFPVRRGDVIGFRLVEPNPIAYTAGTECSARYYMNHQDQQRPCDQYIMQRTAVCRIYPVKAMVIWDNNELGQKAEDCTDETSSLVPSSPATEEKRTHIDGCLILNIKSADATYQLTNPDYPNITKHRDLCWVIHLDPKLYADLYIQININDLDLRVPTKCDTYTSDFLEVRDGEWSTSMLLRRYCVGWAADNDDITRTDMITACHHFLYIRLRTSTASFGFKGFKLHYQAIKRSSDGLTCIRYLPVEAPNAGRSRNAAIITIVVIALFVTLVCIIAYVRKRGLKVPQWLSGYLFRHRQFHNHDTAAFTDGNDSPRHNADLRASELQPSGLTNAGHQPSGYVTFVPGGYPSNGEPVLQLAKIAATRPVTTATDSSVMEGVTDIGEPIPDSWSPAANGRMDRHGAGQQIPVDSPLGGVNNINYCPQNDNIALPVSQRLNGINSSEPVT